MHASNYTVLGVSTSATQNEIKKQFHHLSRKHHPDKAKDPNSEEKFKQILAAYNVLKDPQTRQSYDMQIGVRRTRAQPSNPTTSNKNPANRQQPPTTQQPQQRSTTVQTDPSRPGSAGTNQRTHQPGYFDLFDGLFKRGSRSSSSARAAQQESELRKAEQEFQARLERERIFKQREEAEYQRRREAARLQEIERIKRQEMLASLARQAERERLAKQKQEAEARAWAQRQALEKARAKAEAEAQARAQAAQQRALEKARAKARAEAQAREQAAQAERNLLHKLQSENKLLLSSLGFLDRDGFVDSDVMRQFKAYSMNFPTVVQLEEMLNSELLELKTRRELEASKPQHIEATRHFAQEPGFVDLTGEDENGETTRDLSSEEPEEPVVINLDDEIMNENEECDFSTIDAEIPISKRNEKSAGSAKAQMGTSKRSFVEDDTNNRPSSKRSRPLSKGETFNLLDDLEDLSEALPHAPPEQYNPKKDTWYQQDVPSHSRPSSSQTKNVNNAKTPEGHQQSASAAELREHHLEVIRYGKETAKAFYERFCELEKHVPKSPEASMPQPTESFEQYMEKTRAPMREMSEWFEKMIQLNKFLQENGKPL